MMVRRNLDNTVAADNVLGVTSQSRHAGTERYQYTPYGQRTTYTHGWIRADINDDSLVNIAGWDLFAAAYSGSPDPEDRSDLDGDGLVGTSDLDIIGPNNQWDDSLPANDPSVMHPQYRSFRNMDGFGNTQATALCEFGHQGLMHDEEFMVQGQAGSQLIYNRARTLHPGLGRFMQRDPLGYVDGMGLYEYVGSNSTNYVDPAGFRRMVIAFEGWGTTIGVSRSFVNHSDPAYKVVADKVQKKDWRYFDWTKYEAAKQAALIIAKKKIQNVSSADCYHTLIIVGFSNGGDAAHDLAHDLKTEGISVNLVVTMDSIPRGVRGVTSILGNPKYSKSENVNRWINYYQRFAAPKGWSVSGAEVDHQFTSRYKKAGWKEATYKQVYAGVQDPVDTTKWLYEPVYGLEEIVKGTPFSFAEHVSVPLHPKTLSGIRASVSNVSEWRTNYKYTK